MRSGINRFISLLEGCYSEWYEECYKGLMRSVIRSVARCYDGVMNNATTNVIRAL